MQDQDCGSRQTETECSDACPVLGLVGAALGELRQHHAPGRQAEQCESGDHRLAVPSEDENVKQESENEAGSDRGNDDQAYMAVSSLAIFLGGYLVARMVR